MLCSRSTALHCESLALTRRPLLRDAQRGGDFIGAEFARITFIMEQNESPDPLHICPLSTNVIVPGSYQLTELCDSEHTVLFEPQTGEWQDEY